MVEKIDLLIESKARLNDIKKTLRTLNELKEAGHNVDASMKDVEKRTKELGFDFGRLKESVKTFRAELLSMMFGFMMLNRAITRIATASISEFKRATESTTYWNTALGQLSLSFSVIKIAIGEALNTALMPFADWLTKHINDILDWISKNDELIGNFIIFAGLFTAGGVVYTALSLFNDGVKKASGGITNLSKLAGTAIGFTLLIKGFDDLSEGNVWSGLSEIFSGFGLILVTQKGMGGLATGLLATGLILGLIDVAWSGEADFVKRLNLALLGAAIGFKLGGPWGAGLGLVVTLALTEVFINKDKIKKQLLRTLPRYIKRPLGLDEDSKSGNYGYPQRQFGGIIPATGLYKMHAGEQIINPKFNSNVTVNASVSSNIDIVRMAHQVSDVIMRDAKRFNTTVTRYG